MVCSWKNNGRYSTLSTVHTALGHRDRAKECVWKEAENKKNLIREVKGQLFRDDRRYLGLKM